MEYGTSSSFTDTGLGLTPTGISDSSLSSTTLSGGGLGSTTFDPSVNASGFDPSVNAFEYFGSQPTGFEMPERDGFESAWIGPQPTGNIEELDGYKEYQELLQKNQNKEDKMGFWEAFLSEETIPWYGSISTGIDLGRVAITAKRLNDGQSVSDEDLLTFNIWYQDQQRKADASRSGQVGMIIGTSMAMGGEMAMTLGAGAALNTLRVGKAAAGKFATKYGEKSVAQAARKAIYKKTHEYVAEALGPKAYSTFMGRNAARLAGAAADMAATGAVTFGAKEAATLGGTALFGDEATTPGAAQRMIYDPTLSKREALLSDAGDMFIEYVSEASGAYLAAGASKALRKLPGVAKYQDEVAELMVKGHDTTASYMEQAKDKPFNAMLEVISPRMGRKINAMLLTNVERIGAGETGDELGKAAGEAAQQLLNEGRRIAAMGMFVAEYATKHQINMDTAIDILRDMGYNGVLEEFGEERAGGFLRGISGFGEASEKDKTGLRYGNLDMAAVWDQTKVTLDQALTEVISFAAVPVALGAFRGTLSLEAFGGKMQNYTQHQEVMNRMYNQDGHDLKAIPDSDATYTFMADGVEQKAEMVRAGQGKALRFIDNLLNSFAGAKRGDLDMMMKEAGASGANSFVGLYNNIYFKTKQYLQAENEKGKSALSEEEIEAEAKSLARDGVRNTIATSARFIRLAEKSTTDKLTDSEIKEITDFINPKDDAEKKIDVHQTPYGSVILVDGKKFDAASEATKKWMEENHLTKAVHVSQMDLTEKKEITDFHKKNFATMTMQEKQEVLYAAGLNPYDLLNPEAGVEGGGDSILTKIEKDWDIRAEAIKEATRTEVRQGDLVDYKKIDSEGKEKRAAVKSVDGTTYTLENGDVVVAGEYSVTRVAPKVIREKSEIIYGTLDELKNEEYGLYGVDSVASPFSFSGQRGEQDSVNGEKLYTVRAAASMSRDGNELIMDKSQWRGDTLEDLNEGAHKQANLAIQQHLLAPGEEANELDLGTFGDDIVDRIGDSVERTQKALFARAKALRTKGATVDSDLTNIPKSLHYLANDSQALWNAAKALDSVKRMAKSETPSDRWEVFHKYWLLTENQLSEEKRFDSEDAISQAEDAVRAQFRLTDSQASKETKLLVSDIATRRSAFGFAFSVMPTIEELYPNTDKTETRNKYQQFMTNLVGEKNAELAHRAKPNLGNDEERRMSARQKQRQDISKTIMPINESEKIKLKTNEADADSALKTFKQKRMTDVTQKNKDKIPNLEKEVTELAQMYAEIDENGDEVYDSDASFAVAAKKELSKRGYKPKEQFTIMSEFYDQVRSGKVNETVEQTVAKRTKNAREYARANPVEASIKNKAAEIEKAGYKNSGAIPVFNKKAGRTAVHWGEDTVGKQEPEKGLESLKKESSYFKSEKATAKIEEDSAKAEAMGMPSVGSRLNIHFDSGGYRAKKATSSRLNVPVVVVGYQEHFDSKRGGQETGMYSILSVNPITGKNYLLNPGLFTGKTPRNIVEVSNGKYLHVETVDSEAPASEGAEDYATDEDVETDAIDVEAEVASDEQDAETAEFLQDLMEDDEEVDDEISPEEAAMLEALARVDESEDDDKKTYSLSMSLGDFGELDKLKNVLEKNESDQSGKIKKSYDSVVTALMGALKHGGFDISDNVTDTFNLLLKRAQYPDGEEGDLEFIAEASKALSYLIYPAINTEDKKYANREAIEVILSLKAYEIREKQSSENQQSKGLQQRVMALAKRFTRILKSVSQDYIDEVNVVVDAILMYNDFSPLDKVLELNKGRTEYSAEEALGQSEHALSLIDSLNKSYIPYAVGGSLSYVASGYSVLRDPNIKLHDLDVIFDSEADAHAAIDYIYGNYDTTTVVFDEDKRGLYILPEKSMDLVYRDKPEGRDDIRHYGAFDIIDRDTGSVIGTREYVVYNNGDTEENLSGVRALLFDPLLGNVKAGEQKRINIHGVSVPFSNVEDGIAAKLKYLRIKDLLDYRNFQKKQRPKSNQTHSLSRGINFFAESESGDIFTPGIMPWGEVGKTLNAMDAVGRCDNCSARVSRLLNEQGLPSGVIEFQAIAFEGANPGTHRAAVTEINGKRFIVDQPQKELVGMREIQNKDWERPEDFIGERPSETHPDFVWATNAFYGAGISWQALIKQVDDSDFGSNGPMLSDIRELSYDEVKALDFPDGMLYGSAESKYYLGRKGDWEMLIDAEHSYPIAIRQISGTSLQNLQSEYKPRFIPATEKAVMEAYGSADGAAKAESKKLISGKEESPKSNQTHSLGRSTINQRGIRYNREMSTGIAEILDSARLDLSGALRKMEEQRDEINKMHPSLQMKMYRDLVTTLRREYNLNNQSRKKLGRYHVSMLNAYLLRSNLLPAITSGDKFQTIYYDEGKYYSDPDGERGLDYNVALNIDKVAEFIYTSPNGTSELDTEEDVPTDEGIENEAPDIDAERFESGYEDDDNAQFKSAEQAIKEILKARAFEGFIRRFKFGNIVIKIREGRISHVQNRFAKERIVTFFENPEANKLMEVVLKNEDTYNEWSSAFMNAEAIAFHDKLIAADTANADAIRQAFIGVDYKDAVCITAYAQSIPIYSGRNAIYGNYNGAETQLTQKSNPNGSPALHAEAMINDMAKNMRNMDAQKFRNKMRKYKVPGWPTLKAKEANKSLLDTDIVHTIVTVMDGESREKKYAKAKEWLNGLVPDSANDKVNAELIRAFSAITGFEEARLTAMATNDRIGFKFLVDAFVIRALVHPNDDFFYTVVNKNLKWSKGKAVSAFARLAGHDLEYMTGNAFMYNSVDGNTVPASRMNNHFREEFLKMPGKTKNDFAMLTGLKDIVSGDSASKILPSDIIKTFLDMFNNNAESTGAEDMYWFAGMPIGEKFAIPMYRMQKHSLETIIGKKGDVGIYQMLYEKKMDELEKAYPGSAEHMKKMYMTPEALEEYINSLSEKGRKNFKQFSANYALNRLILDEYLMGSPMDYEDDIDQFKRSSNLGTPYIRPVLNIDGGLKDTSKVLVVNIPKGLEMADDGATYAIAEMMEAISISYGSRIRMDTPGQLKMACTMILRDDKGLTRRINIKSLLNRIADGSVDPEIVKLGIAIAKYNEAHPDGKILFFTDTNSAKELYSKSKAVGMFINVNGKRKLNDAAVNQLLNGSLDPLLLTIDNKHMGLINEQDYNPEPHNRAMLKQYFAVVGQFDEEGRISELMNQLVRAQADRTMHDNYAIEELLIALDKDHPQVAEMIREGTSLHNPIISDLVYETLSGVIRRSLRPKNSGLLTSELGDSEESLRGMEVVKGANGEDHVRLNELRIGGKGLRADKGFGSYDAAVNYVSKHKKEYPEKFPLGKNGLPDYSDMSIVENEIEERIINGERRFIVPGEVAGARRNPTTVGSSNVIGTVKELAANEDGKEITSLSMPKWIQLWRGSDSDGDWDHVQLLYRHKDKKRKGEAVLYSDKEEADMIAKAAAAGYKGESMRGYNLALQSIANKILLKEVEINRNPEFLKRLNEAVNPTRWKHLADEMAERGNTMSQVDFDYKNEDGSRPVNLFSTFMYHRNRSGITGTHKVGHAVKATMSSIYALQDWKKEGQFVEQDAFSLEKKDGDLPYNLILSRTKKDERAIRNAALEVIKADFDITNAVLDDTKNNQALDLGLDVVQLVVYMLSSNPNLGLNKEGWMATREEVAENIDAYMRNIVHYMNSKVMLRYRQNLNKQEGVFANKEDIFMYTVPGEKYGTISNTYLGLRNAVGAKTMTRKDFLVAKSGQERALVQTINYVYKKSKSEENIAAVEFLSALIEGSLDLSRAGRAQELYDKNIKGIAELEEAKVLFRKIDSIDSAYPELRDSIHSQRSRTTVEVYDALIPNNGLYDNEDIIDAYNYVHASYGTIRPEQHEKFVRMLTSVAVTNEGLSRFGVSRGELCKKLIKLFDSDNLLKNSVLRKVTTIGSLETGLAHIRLNADLSLGLTERDIEVLQEEMSRISKIDKLDDDVIKDGNDILLALVLLGEKHHSIFGTYRTGSFFQFMPARFIATKYEPLYKNFIDKMNNNGYTRAEFYKMREQAARIARVGNYPKSSVVQYTPTESSASSYPVESIITTASQVFIPFDNDGETFDGYSKGLAGAYRGAVNLFDPEISTVICMGLPMNTMKGIRDPAILFGQSGELLADAVAAGLKVVLNGTNMIRLANDKTLKNDEQKGIVAITKLWDAFARKMEEYGVLAVKLPDTGDPVDNFRALVEMGVAEADVEELTDGTKRKTGVFSIFGSKMIKQPVKVAPREEVKIAEDAKKGFTLPDDYNKTHKEKDQKKASVATRVIAFGQEKTSTAKTAIAARDQGIPVNQVTGINSSDVVMVSLNGKSRGKTKKGMTALEENFNKTIELLKDVVKAKAFIVADTKKNQERSFNNHEYGEGGLAEWLTANGYERYTDPNAQAEGDYRGVGLWRPAEAEQENGLEAEAQSATELSSYDGSIETLGKNDVFVFGSNLAGFHGAGSAGYASFNEPGNVWRSKDYGSKPNGWKGKWNVKGNGEGLQEGTEGMSYALPTVTRAGAKRSRTPAEITASIRKMYNEAIKNPDKRFLVAGITSGRTLNGYSHEQLAEMYANAGPIPKNVIFSKSYAGLIAEKITQPATENAVSNDSLFRKPKTFSLARATILSVEDRSFSVERDPSDSMFVATDVMSPGSVFTAETMKGLEALIEQSDPPERTTHSLSMANMYLPYDKYGEKNDSDRTTKTEISSEYIDEMDLSGPIKALKQAGYSVIESNIDYLDPLARIVGMSTSPASGMIKLISNEIGKNLAAVPRIAKMFSESVKGKRLNPREIISEMMTDAFLANTESWNDTLHADAVRMIDRIYDEIMSGNGTYIDPVYTGGIYNSKNFTLKDYGQDKAAQSAIEEAYTPTDIRTPEERATGVIEGVSDDVTAIRTKILTLLPENATIDVATATLNANGYAVARRQLSRSIGGTKYSFGIVKAGQLPFLLSNMNGIYSVIPASVDAIQAQTGATEKQARALMDKAWSEPVYTHTHEGGSPELEAIITGYANALRKRYVANGYPYGSADVAARNTAEEWAREFKELDAGLVANHIKQLPYEFRYLAKAIKADREKMKIGENNSPLKTRDDLNTYSLDIAIHHFRYMDQYVLGGSDALHDIYKQIVRDNDADNTKASAFIRDILIALGAETMNAPKVWYPGTYIGSEKHDEKDFVVSYRGKMAGAFKEESEAQKLRKKLNKERYIPNKKENEASTKMRMALQAVSDALQGYKPGTVGYKKQLKKALEAHIYTGHKYREKTIETKRDEALSLFFGMFNSQKKLLDGTPAYSVLLSAHQLSLLSFLHKNGYMNYDFAQSELERMVKIIEDEYHTQMAKPLSMKEKAIVHDRYVVRRAATIAEIRKDFPDPYSNLSKVQASLLIYSGLKKWAAKEKGYIFKERVIEYLTDDAPLTPSDIEIYWDDYRYNHPNAKKMRQNILDQIEKLRAAGKDYAHGAYAALSKPNMGLSQNQQLKALEEAGYKHAVQSKEIVDEYNNLRVNPDGSKTEFGKITKDLDEVVTLGAKAYDWFRKKANRDMSKAGVHDEWLRAYMDKEGGTYVPHRWKIDTPEDEAALDLLMTRVSRYKETTKHTNERVLNTFKDAAEFGFVSISPFFDETYRGYIGETLKVKKNILALSIGATARDSALKPNWIMEFNEESDRDEIIDNTLPSAFNNRIVRNMLGQLATYVNFTRRSLGEKEFYVDLKAEPRLEYNRLIRAVKADGLSKYGFDELKLGVSPFKSISKYYVNDDGKSEKLLRHLVELPVGTYIDSSGKMQQKTWVKVVDSINNWGKDIGIATTSSFSVNEHGTLGFNLGVLGIRVPLVPRVFKPHQFRRNIPFSLFHAFSLLESFRAFMGVTTIDSSFILNGMKYFKTLSNYKSMLEDNPHIMERYTRAGLTASFDPPDVDFGLVSRQINWMKENSSGFMARSMERWNEDRMEARKWLWQGLHPAMKMFCFDKATEEIAKKNKNLSRDFIDQSVARMVNNAFGGQRWEEYIWANPKRRHLLTMFMFAPDWTLSAANIAGLTALPGLREAMDIGTNNIEKSWMKWKYWPAMFAIVMTAIPMVTQAVITGIAKGVGGDDDDDYKWFTFNNEYGKNGWFGTGVAAHVDITAAARALPGPFKYEGGPPGSRHLYMRWAKQATEVFEGWMQKPFQTLLSKTSTSFKIALEQAFGRSISLKNSFPLDFNGQPLFTGIIKGEDDGFFGSRTGYIARKFIPLTLVSALEKRPTMATLQFAPMSKGMSRFAIEEKMQETLKSYADAGQYARLQKNPTTLRQLAIVNKRLVDVAIINGFDPVERLQRARGAVLGSYYDDFFKAINNNKMDKATEAADSIRRLGRNFSDIVSSIKRKYGDNPELLTDEIKQRVYDAYVGSDGKAQ